MLRIVALDMLYEEEINLSDVLKSAYAKRDLPIKHLAVFNEFSAFLKSADEQIDRNNVFIASFAKIRDEYIEFSQAMRKSKESAFIVFVIDKKVDITSCVRPSVRPSGILYIPLERSRIYQTIREIYIEYLRLTVRGKQPVFKIKTGGDYFTINTGEISFFEAQGKKIAVKTKGQEILFYSTFDAILEQLPDCFIRCHKGYVVNITQITQASFTEMLLTLKDKSVIPISRTYRDDVRMCVERKGV